MEEFKLKYDMDSFLKEQLNTSNKINHLKNKSLTHNDLLEIGISKFDCDNYY